MENIRRNEIFPLENPLVLAEIFGFLNTLDLVQVNRSVCKTWHQASIPQWKILAPVKLVQDPRYESLDIGTKSVCSFLDDLENRRQMEKFIHQTFTLKWWRITNAHFHQSPAQIGFNVMNNLFWTTCGQNVTTLTLSQCQFPYNHCLLPGSFWKAVPNLENLSLLNCFMEWDVASLFDLDDITAVKVIPLEELRQRIPQMFGRLVPRESPPPLLVQDQNIEVFPVGVNVVPPVRGGPDEMFAPNKQWQKDEEELQKEPVKLKFLKIHNLHSQLTNIPISWCDIMKLFPKLERIFVSQQNITEYTSVDDRLIDRKLKELDVMNISRDCIGLTSETILNLPTQRISFDCGFKTEREQVCSVVELHADGLKKLALCRAPFGQPYSRFPCNIGLLSLTRLHLWGNVSANLSFLKLTPILQHFSWNTCCYEEKMHGARLYSELGREAELLSVDALVSNNYGLGNNFRLENLESLELYGGECLGSISLRKLATWMPNVTTFGTTVVEGAKLCQILTQWANLKSLELKHGSTVTTEHIIYACLNLAEFQYLNRFTWKWCPCFGEKSMTVDEICAAHFLRRTCEYTVVHPWKRPEGERVQQNVGCLHALFDSAIAGRDRDVDKFRHACRTLTRQNEQ